MGITKKMREQNAKRLAEKAEAEEEGRDARRMGKAYSINPYSMSEATKRVGWNIGWTKEDKQLRLGE